MAAPDSVLSLPQILSVMDGIQFLRLGQLQMPAMATPTAKFVCN